MEYKGIHKVHQMWRTCLCILLVLPFLILPVLWFTFPSTCQDGHIHYSHSHDNDTIHEPWHCHIPRMSGCACTPGYDCFTGGIYGPTNNGSILIIAVIVGIFALFYISGDHDHHTIEYQSSAVPVARAYRVPAVKARGLDGYPLR